MLWRNTDGNFSALGQGSGQFLVSPAPGSCPLAAHAASRTHCPFCHGSPSLSPQPGSSFPLGTWFGPQLKESPPPLPKNSLGRSSPFCFPRKNHSITARPFLPLSSCKAFPSADQF